MLKRILKIIVLVSGLIASLFAMGLLVEEVSTIATWSKSGIINTSFSDIEDSLIIIDNVSPSEFISSTYPDSGDVVLVEGDSTSNIRTVLRKLNKGMPPGTQVSFRYLHDNDTLSATFQTRQVESNDLYINIILESLRFLGTFGFLLVGLWAYFKRPNSGVIYALAMFCISMASFMAGSVSITFDGIRGIEIPLLDYLNIPIRILALLFGAFWLNLQILFPRPSNLVSKHLYISHAIVYLPIVITSVLSVTIPLSLWGTITTIVIMVQVWTGFIILGINYGKAKDPLEKRQTRLVLWGSGTGLLAMFIVAVLALAFREWFVSLGAMVLIISVIIVFLGLLLIPISFAYAFGKYRLLEVEGKLRRGTRFAAFTVLLLIVFYVAIYGISEILINTFDIESRAPALMLALLLAIGFTPAQRKIQLIAESKIYPERKRLREMLRDFLSHAATYADKATFWDDMENHLKDVLKIESVQTFIYNEQDHTFYQRKKLYAAPFSDEHPLIQELLGLRACPLMLDEALGSNRLQLTDEEKPWLLGQHIAMILPLETRSKLVGFIGLGFKSERDDYNAEECSILMSLASQIAITSENLQLLEDNIEKNRLEKELGMARNVQQGLLPEQIPETPGLEIAAQSKFCLEVAGDYYDVINIDSNRTVLAIGDVSGKGAAAALMMSNIQASFRTAVGLGTGTGNSKDGTAISEIVYRINNLIHNNTPPGQFITFFVGVYDSSDNSFTYVNAGHNQPMLFRGNGSVELLDKGGLLLGAMPDMPYEQDTVKLAAGDVVFLYTDGVSEAENSSDDMYGEKRIESLVKENLANSTSEILAMLEDDVKTFIGDVPLSDDYTVLVARVK